MVVDVKAAGATLAFCQWGFDNKGTLEKMINDENATGATLAISLRCLDNKDNQLLLICDSPTVRG